MKIWLMCHDCTWQAESPFDEGYCDEVIRTRGALCPACQSRIVLVQFDRRTWMQLGADLLAGNRKVREFVPKSKNTTPHK